MTSLSIVWRNQPIGGAPLPANLVGNLVESREWVGGGRACTSGHNEPNVLINTTPTFAACSNGVASMTNVSDKVGLFILIGCLLLWVVYDLGCLLLWVVYCYGLFMIWVAYCYGLFIVMGCL